MPVYFIGHLEDTRPPILLIKIGRARNVKKRLSALQTGNPKDLLLLGWINTDDDGQYERALHRRFSDARERGEWFNIEPADIVPLLHRAGQDGFIAKNADAFEVTGYDKDAVPEFLGVWRWGDLEIEECCPFCGCFCGMHFQEASWMHHCINCDMLTDFSEISPNEKELGT